MKTRLLHPLWTHIPAVAALIFIIVYTIAMGPLPSNAPIHWDFHGQIDSYGSPYIGFGIIVGLSVIFIGISVLFDELWARQEKRKRFNWFSLFDELTVGFMVGVYTGYLQHLKSGNTSFSFPWILIIIIAGTLLIAAIILDRLRPFHPQEKVPFSDTLAREKDLEEKMKQGEAFIHWESQNPFWITLITVILPVIMLAAAAVAWFSITWVSLILAVTGIMMVFPYGGMQTTVTRREISVRFGIIGLRVLRLKTEEIANIELAEFSPIADFGGYGIRFNREMSAYYMHGNRGIKLTTTKGKKYIIGSDNPEELYAVARTVVKGK
jgi:hypothetical protein